MKVLLTGHRGFLGTALMWEMINSGHKVSGMDVKDGALYDILSPLNLDRAFVSSEAEIVVHLAAEVGKLNCEQDPERATEVNVIGTFNVAQACADHGIPLVYCSTSEVYGDLGNSLIFEDEPGDDRGTSYFGDDISGMYALTKRWGEEICWTYAPADLKIIRPAMPYGPGVPPGPGRRALDNLVHQALTVQPMIVHRGAARSWCWIDDVASGIRAVIERGEPGVYNVGRDDDEVSMYNLAMKIGWMVSDRFGLDHIDPPARQTAVKRISCAKLRALGWEPKTSLDEGLPQMVAWIRSWMDSQEVMPNTD